MTQSLGTPPTLSDLDDLASQALAAIPESLARHTAGVVIRVEDFADPEILDELGIESPFGLMGLYQGVSLDRRSISDVAMDVDMIFLYRRPLLDVWAETGEDLAHLVRHVLIHEIGHHFGFSDDDMDRIEREADTATDSPTRP